MKKEEARVHCTDQTQEGEALNVVINSSFLTSIVPMVPQFLFYSPFFS